MEGGGAVNVYHTPQYQAFRRECAFVFSEEHRAQLPGEVTQLPGGWSVRTDYYTGQLTYQIRAARHVLLDGRGQTVYTWDSLDYDGEFSALISHASGRHYLVFREDLYGYSVLEVETGRTAHYIPERSWPLDGRQAGETFIWTGVQYDPRSGLLAVSGCYWACPNGTLLLDFSDPLEEQDCDCWLDVHEAVDPDYDRYDVIDLERFGEDGLLYFRTSSAVDGSWGAFTLPADRALALAREKKSVHKERE